MPGRAMTTSWPLPRRLGMALRPSCVVSPYSSLVNYQQLFDP
jgi:hypothetical protein